MRVRPIAFAGAHRCAAAIYFGGRGARVATMSMTKADLRSRPGARAILEVRACSIGVNAETGK
jgi:hypothetical protein